MSEYRAAYELEQSTLNGRKLINEVNRWIISRQKALIRRMEENTISRAELDKEMAEIRQMELQLEALAKQIKASEEKVKKVFENDENNGQ